MCEHQYCRFYSSICQNQPLCAERAANYVGNSASVKVANANPDSAGTFSLSPRRMKCPMQYGETDIAIRKAGSVMLGIFAVRVWFQLKPLRTTTHHGRIGETDESSRPSQCERRKRKPCILQGRIQTVRQMKRKCFCRGIQLDFQILFSSTIRVHAYKLKFQPE